MSKRSHSSDLTEPSDAPLQAPVKLKKSLWKRYRPANAEEASLWAVEPRPPSTSSHGTEIEAKIDTKQVDHDRHLEDRESNVEQEKRERHVDDVQTTIWFPSLLGSGPMATDPVPHPLPNQFGERFEGTRLHIFAFEQMYYWTPETQENAKLSIEEQIRTQIDPEVGGKPDIFFPSQPSRYLDITFRKAKRYSKGHSLKLSWNGRSLHHEKIGDYLPDDEIILSLRGISTRINLVELLHSVQEQLEDVVEFKAFQAGREKRRGSGTRSFTRNKITILARFRSRSFHAGMLPDRIGYHGQPCKLYFEDRENVCEPCRFYNINLCFFSVLMEEPICSLCGYGPHCEYACGPEADLTKMCDIDPRPDDAKD